MKKSQIKAKIQNGLNFQPLDRYFKVSEMCLILFGRVWHQ